MAAEGSARGSDSRAEESGAVIIAGRRQEAFSEWRAGPGSRGTDRRRQETICHMPFWTYDDAHERLNVLCLKYAVPILKQQGGSIVNMSSSMGLYDGFDRHGPNMVS